MIDETTAVAGIPIGLTYDDVLLEPRRSRVRTRRQVDTRTKLSRHVELAIPIVSANMDTVTEAEMAIAMARMGGLGILHRFMPIERQVAEVRRVKRSVGWVIEQPQTITPDATIADARRRMTEEQVSGFPVVDAENTLVGMLTRRDILLAGDDETAAARMRPRDRLVVAPAGIDLDQALAILDEHRIEKLPLVDQQGRLAGLITLRDLLRRQRFTHMTTDAKGRLRVGAAIGVVGDYRERARALVAAGADVLVLDIAHGHAEHALTALERVKSDLPQVDVVAGNVATAAGVDDLVQAGADGVKVGVGPGSVCTTRLVAGVGVPQLTAVMRCGIAGARLGVPICADGGIRYAGDIVKALAAGAQTVMIGNLLAGTRESPGVVIVRGGRKVKIARGMASAEARLGRSQRENPELGWAAWEHELEEVIPEGIEAAVPYRGEAQEVIFHLVGGLRSGMSYCDALTIPELQTNATFIRMTPAGLKESAPHDVEAL
ncbi:MAG: IMP dehydrogenase [Chloroflexi bacterium]|nr:IMP dehydrogenase [Chloroflexota bacterium]